MARAVLQKVVGHRYQGVFFAKEFAVFADKDEAIDIWVYDDAQITLRFRNQGTNLVEVLAQGLGVVRKVPRGLAVKPLDALDAKGLEKHGDGDSASRSHGVEGDCEAASANSFDVDEVEVQNGLDVALDSVGDRNAATQFTHWGKFKRAGGAGSENFGSVFSAQKFSAGVQQLECVPLAGVVRCSQNDSAVAALPGYHHFDGRSRRQAEVKHVDTLKAQRRNHEVAQGFARNARIAT